MMATTHVFAGVALAAVVAVFAPEFALVAAGAAILGGAFPDFDLYAGHRKTLHFPVYYSVCILPSATLAALNPTTVTVGVTVFFLAAALHSVMDALGGGLELKPWEGTSEEAVYSHYHGEWVRPRRWVRYDGAPEDLLLASVLAVPGLLVFDGRVRDVLLALLAVSITYTLARKPMVWIAEFVIDRLPERVLAYVPVRFLPVEEGALEGRSES
ncbi:metal-dependent hydrolase [Halobacteria archaeon AArc-m2/3/4]|uniref:Metal-dependent hydrolase n=1 Tax=Natronoglomus mannanivorans TaxID=2979990 RepID=A0ABT2QCK2_9EURY|nr:metal-dependent hydrolase [Halobacteria archaeon AArc-m2/3/4]